MKNVNKWGTALLAVVMGINLAGCGGGGGGDDDDDGGSNGNAAVAPASLGGKEVTFYSGTLGTRAITFNTDNATWSEVRDGATVTGSYQYNRESTPNNAQLVVNDQGQDQAIILNFNSRNSGAFAFRDQRDNGTFEMHAINNGGNGNEPPPNGGLAVSSLAGRTMYGTRTYTSTGPVGQTHTYTFSISTFHDSDPPEESDGSYFYTPNGNDATLDLSYHSPAGFNGDKHALNMTFHTETAGVFDSTYTRRDGTVIQINGTFRIE